MKLAASLTLAFALLLGSWSLFNWVSHDGERINAMNHAWQSLDLAEVNKYEDLSATDRNYAFVAFGALVASIVMFSKGRG